MTQKRGTRYHWFGPEGVNTEQVVRLPYECEMLVDR